MLCIAAASPVLAIATSAFTLSWTHSVQHTQWWERWQITAQGLAPVEARVTSAGAGMDAPPDAIWEKDGWHYTPHVPPQHEVFLAASGATGGGWTLCAKGQCQVLGAKEEAPIRLWSAPSCQP